MLRRPYFSLMMGAVRISETSVYSNDTTRRYIPEGCHLQLQLLFLNY
jgi:hypothetical protein